MAFLGQKQGRFSLLRSYFCLEKSVSSCQFLRQIRLLKLLESVSKILSRNFSKYIWIFVLLFNSSHFRHLHVFGEQCSTHWYQVISLQPYCNPHSPFFLPISRKNQKSFLRKNTKCPNSPLCNSPLLYRNKMSKKRKGGGD